MNILIVFLSEAASPVSFIGAIWAMIYFYGKYKEKHATPDMSRPKMNMPPVKKRPDYYANGQLLKCSHHVHYYKVLGMPGHRIINPATIELFTSQLSQYGERSNHLKRTSSSIMQIAAREYFIDRWNYLTHLN